MAAKRTRMGLRVELPDFNVDGVTPGGVYIENGKVKVWLHYSPPDGLENYQFVLPGDAAFLREFANAILQVADDVDTWRNPKRS